MTANGRTVRTNKLTRTDICDLLLACTALKHNTDAKKWEKLHDKLKEILDEHDTKYDEDC